MQQTVTYICPSCGAYLRYDGAKQAWICDYCDNEYTKEDLEQRGVQTTDNTTQQPQNDINVTFHENVDVAQTQENLYAYVCPSCGAEIVTDDATAATFCMFCQNPTVMPQKFTGKYQPSAIVPFATDKEQAQKAFLKLCKGKKLLPPQFTSKQRLEKITGIYVPFWLFDCKADFDYQATGENMTLWSDSTYQYTKTDVYHIVRSGRMDFENIPLDASKNMEDAMMDALEPFDFTKKQPFDMRYLSGFFAEKYQYEPKDLFQRMKNRISHGIQNKAAESGRQYDHVHSVRCATNIQSDKQAYLLLPVWMLVSNFKGKKYLFAMNGQTGKMVGELPCDGRQAVKWFLIIFLIVLVITAGIAFVMGGGF